jgi:hypothetical protein
VLARFNHIFWDGISARMMVGELLVRLGQTASGIGRGCFPGMTRSGGVQGVSI